MQYTIWEFLVYGFLRSGSMIFFAYFILRKHGRFSQQVTAFLFVLMTCCWVGISALAVTVLKPYSNTPIVEILETIMLIVFVLVAIRERIGKLLFVFFMLYTVGGLVSLAGKFIEIKWWPDMAYRGYCWTASLTVIISIALVMTPFGIAIYRDIVAVLGKQGESTAWGYCWLIPATFYLFWLQGLYTSPSALEYASEFGNILYMAVINASAYLVYHMVMRMIIEHNKLLEIRAENQALNIQVTQFEDLRDRIVDARRTRHDLRHHVAVLETIAEEGDREALRKYIDEFRNGHRLEEPMQYCENTTANAVLAYFAQMANEAGITCDIRFAMPAEVSLEASDIAVLLGNLMENAVDACSEQTSGERRIIVRGDVQEGGAFACIIDNTADAAPEKSRDGRFLSSKHKGHGIGTDSVRSIAARYGGVTEYAYQDGMFRASVMLYLYESPVPQDDKKKHAK